MSALQAFLGYVFGAIMLKGGTAPTGTGCRVEASSYANLYPLQQLVATAPFEPGDAGFRE